MSDLRTKIEAYVKELRDDRLRWEKAEKDPYDAAEAAEYRALATQAGLMAATLEFMLEKP